MPVIPNNFDGAFFMSKFAKGQFDFRVDGDQLICPSLPNLTDEDIADCVVDMIAYGKKENSKANRRAAAVLSLAPLVGRNISSINNNSDRELLNRATYFILGICDEDGVILATPVNGNGSLVSLVSKDK